MHPATITPTSRMNVPAEAIAARVRAPLYARDAEFDEFRRVDYTQGWDTDDALLGWIDDDVVRGSRRKH